MGTLVKFRRLKHGDPTKLKVLAEDIRRARRSAGLSWLVFSVLVGVACVATFAASFMLSTGRLNSLLSWLS